MTQKFILSFCYLETEPSFLLCILDSFLSSYSVFLRKGKSIRWAYFVISIYPYVSINLCAFALFRYHPIYYIDLFYNSLNLA